MQYGNYALRYGMEAIKGDGRYPSGYPTPALHSLLVAKIQAHVDVVRPCERALALVRRALPGVRAIGDAGLKEEARRVAEEAARGGN